MLAPGKKYIFRRVQTVNSILYNPAETELDIRCITTETAATEDMYSTTPLKNMRSIYRQSNEEELHSSFEEAISDRVLVLNRQLRRVSIPFTDNVSIQSPLSSEVKMPSLSARLTSIGQASRQAMLHIAIAFMLVMVGFDLMGLLVLHMRK
jgi:hypothetical protein